MADVLVRTRNVERTKSDDGTKSKKRGSVSNQVVGGKKTSTSTEGDAIAISSTGRKKGSGSTATGSKLKRHSSGTSKDGTVGSALSTESTNRSKKRPSSRSTATSNSRHNSSSNSNDKDKDKDKDQKKSKSKPRPASRAKSFDDCSFPVSNTDANTGIKLRKGERPALPPELRKQKSASELLTASSEHDGEGRTKRHQQKSQGGDFQQSMPHFGYTTPKHQIVHDLFVKRRTLADDDQDEQGNLMVPSLTPNSTHGDDDDDDNQNTESAQPAEMEQRIEKNSRSTKRESFSKKLPRNPPRSNAQAPLGSGEKGEEVTTAAAQMDPNHYAKKQEMGKTSNILKDRPKGTPLRRHSGCNTKDSDDDGENDGGTSDARPNARAHLNNNDSSIRGSRHNNRQQARATSSRPESLHGNSGHGDQFVVPEVCTEPSSRRNSKDPPRPPTRERSTSNRGKSYSRTTAPSSLLKPHSQDVERDEDDEISDGFHHSNQPPAASKNDGGSKLDSRHGDAKEASQRASVHRRELTVASTKNNKLVKKKEVVKGGRALHNDENECDDDDKRKSLCGFLPSKSKPLLTGACSVVSANMPDLEDSSFSSMRSNDETVCTSLSHKKPGLVVEAEVKEGPMKDFLGSLTAAIQQKETASGSYHSAGTQSISSQADAKQPAGLPKHASTAYEEPGFGSFIPSNLNAPTMNSSSLLPTGRTASLGTALAKNGGGRKEDDEMSLPSLMPFKKHQQRLHQHDDDASMPSLASFRTQGTNNNPPDFEEIANSSIPSLTSMPDDPSVASLPVHRAPKASRKAEAVYALAQDVVEEDEADVEDGCEYDNVEGEEDEEDQSEFEESVEDEESEQEREEEGGEKDVPETDEETLEFGEETEDDGSLEADEDDISLDEQEDVDEPAVIQNVPRVDKGRDQKYAEPKKQPPKERRRLSKPQPHHPQRQDAPATQFVVKPEKKKKKKKKNAKQEEQVQQWQEEFQQEQLMQQELFWQQQQLLQQQMLQQQYWMQHPGTVVPVAGMDMNSSPPINYMGYNLDPSGQGMNTSGHLVNNSGTGTLNGSSGRDSIGMSNHSDAKQKKSAVKKSQSLDYDFSYLDHPEMPEVSEVCPDDVLVPMNPSAENEASNDTMSKSQARGSRGKKEKEKKAPALSLTSRFKKSVKLIKNNFSGGSKHKTTRIDTGLNDKQFFPDLDDDDDDEESTMQGLLSSSG